MGLQFDRDAMSKVMRDNGYGGQKEQIDTIETEWNKNVLPFLQAVENHKIPTPETDSQTGYNSCIDDVLELLPVAAELALFQRAGARSKNGEGRETARRHGLEVGVLNEYPDSTEEIRSDALMFNIGGEDLPDRRLNEPQREDDRLAANDG